MAGHGAMAIAGTALEFRAITVGYIMQLILGIYEMPRQSAHLKIYNCIAHAETHL
jgi:hypothetical protein